MRELSRLAVRGGLLIKSPWLALAPILLAASILWSWVAAPLPFHAVYTATDDAFYYYSWARHVADGEGPTADGFVATNGVQPLWAWMVTGIALFARDPNGLVTAALALCLALNVLAAAAWVRLAFHLGGLLLAWTTAAILARLYVQYQWVFLTGMEISLNLAAASLLVLGLVRLRAVGRWHGPWRPLTIGVLTAVFLLARVDNVLYFVLPLAYEGVRRACRRPGLFPCVHGRDLPVLAAPAVFSILPYLIWNRVEFGAWMPTSGRVKLILTQQQWDQLGHAQHWWNDVPRVVTTLGQYLDRPFRWATDTVGGAQALSLGLPLGVLGVLLLVLVVSLPSQRRTVGAVAVVAMLSILPRALVHVNGLAWTYLAYAVWYLAAEVLVAVLGVSWIVHGALRLIPRLRGLGYVIRGGLLAAMVVPYLIQAGSAFRWAAAHVPAPTFEPLARIEALRWAEANLPPDAVIGSFNSGLMGFVTTRRVMNLDGRVDDGSLARELEEGREVLPYVLGRGVTHVIDRVYLDRSSFGRFWATVADSSAILARFPGSGPAANDIVVLRLPSGNLSRKPD